MTLKHNLLAGFFAILLTVLIDQPAFSVCDIPTGLATTSITATSAVAGWSAVSGATGYKIRYRKYGTTSWTTKSVTSNYCTITGLTAETSYQWKVMTNCTAGNSSYSSIILFSTLCATPTSLSTSNITTSSAQLNWGSTPCDSFLLRYYETALPNTVYYKVVKPGTATSSSVTGLVSGTNYSWLIRTYCMGGQSGTYSSTMTFTTQNSACPVASGLTSSSITSSSATISWNAAAGAASYNIQYRVSGTSSWTTATSTTTSKSLSGLSSNSTYEFQVQTVCTTGGNSAWSSSATFATTLPPCSTPTGLTASSITTTSATIGWTAVAGAVSYSVRYRITGTTTWTAAGATTNSKSITGLTASSTYEYQVQTLCNGNSSAYSSSSTFTTATSCSVPSGLAATSITSTGATVNWNAAGGAVSYAIQYRKTGTTSWTSTTSSATSKSLTGLTPATNYEFQVSTVCSSGNSPWSASASFTTANSTTLPVPDHIVILIEENHGYSQIIGNASAPYINALANDPMSTLFTQMYGIEHPSQPNYLDLFSGGNQGVTNNNVPSSHFTTANLARELINAGKTFKSYSQNLPSVGWDGASSGKYMRKHNPIANWMGTGTNQVSSTLNQPFTSFPSDYTQLPTVSYVIPDQDYDMHDGTIATADTWFHNNLDGYVQWAKTHNSLFVIIWDEDDGNYNNRIAMIFTGPMVKSGTLSTTYNHYNFLRTIEDMYGTTHAGNAASASAIHGCWVNGYRQNNVSMAGEGFRWEVYPNPASSVINLSYEMDETATPLVSIFDNVGQKVTELFLPTTGSGAQHFSFSPAALGMNRGIYFLEMQVNDKKYLKKVAVLD